MNNHNLPLWDFFSKIKKENYPTLDFSLGDDYIPMMAITILILIVLFILVWIISNAVYDNIDKRRSKIKVLLGELIDKKYNGEQTSSGSGTAIMPNTNGGIGVGVISTSSHSDEEFLFFVKSDKIYKIECDMQQFYSKKIGDQVNFEVTIGGLSNDELKCYLIK